MSNVQNNKRIAKNTIYLYIRMVVVMLVTLYTSRAILNGLGSTDFGIYNAVGGIVTFMGFINGALSGSTSRFLTYALGEGILQKQKNTFGAALNLHLCLALLVLIIGETIGMWFFNEKINIPEERMTAAFWVYQFSILTTMVNFTQVPYNASLIAHENMSVYAYVGLYEAFSKLLIAYLITISPVDSLIFYGLLLLLNTVAIQIFYRVYVIRRYEECHFHLVKDKTIYKQLLGYGSWDLIGNLAVVCQGQGVNLLLNIFFGPIVNTARAIAVQIQGATLQFVGNFMTAVRPQVIKNYAEGNVERMYSLTFYTAKFSYMLMLALSMPICFEIKFILSIWLGNDVPDETSLFAVLVLITYTWRTFHIAALMPYHAIGRIRTGNIIIGTLMILVLPVGYVLFNSGYPSYSVFLAIFVVEFFSVFIVYWIIHNYKYFPYIYLFTKVMLPCFFVTCITLILPVIIVSRMADGWLRLITVVMSIETVLAVTALYIGLDKKERHRIVSFIRDKAKAGISGCSRHLLG